ncbi:ion channel [Actinocorallia herbida]|uniref:Ion channel n=1 Tax=Actinocorallia herbida TaxID=58109 RepID=A0A3N1D5G6_9ACTN|nr:potassium channel family protein [Actinocorallia herbida]ROO88791.1 ion channel [Actinocorallia herbida]
MAVSVPRRVRVWGEAFLAFFGGAIVYFAVPVKPQDIESGFVLRGILLFLSLSLVTAVLIRQGQRVTREGRLPAEQIALLLSMVDLVIVFFALIYYARSAEFSGIATRLDALYFTVSTLCTVGFGDIVPIGQWARIITTVQMIFDLVIVTSLITIILAHARGRMRER